MTAPSTKELIDSIRISTQFLDTFIASLQNVFDFPPMKPAKALNVIFNSLQLLEDQVCPPVTKEALIGDSNV